MMYKSVMIVLLVHQQLSAMDKKRTPPQLIRYQSVVPSTISGIPPLKVLAAQKVHELKRRGLLTPEQLKLFSSTRNSQSSSPEEIICNDVLQGNFAHMSRVVANDYAFDLASGRVARSGSSGRVQQKVLAIEIRDKASR
jgi:hypothetical protein